MLWTRPCGRAAYAADEDCCLGDRDADEDGVSYIRPSRLIVPDLEDQAQRHQDRRDCSMVAVALEKYPHSDHRAGDQSNLPVAHPRERRL